MALTFTSPDDGDGRERDHHADHGAEQPEERPAGDRDREPAPSGSAAAASCASATRPWSRGWLRSTAATAPARARRPRPFLRGASALRACRGDRAGTASRRRTPRALRRSSRTRKLPSSPASAPKRRSTAAGSSRSLWNSSRKWPLPFATRLRKMLLKIMIHTDQKNMTVRMPMMTQPSKVTVAQRGREVALAARRFPSARRRRRPPAAPPCPGCAPRPAAIRPGARVRHLQLVELAGEVVRAGAEPPTVKLPPIAGTVRRLAARFHAIDPQRELARADA